MLYTISETKKNEETDKTDSLQNIIVGNKNIGSKRSVNEFKRRVGKWHLKA
jgi:hypothetical protein